LAKRNRQRKTKPVRTLGEPGDGNARRQTGTSQDGGGAFLRKGGRMTVKRYEDHEFAGLLPTTSDEDYHRIRDDIRANGQRVPIVLFQGRILDGRTRYKACIELGKPPMFDIFRGSARDALRHVASHNLFRRHLTPSQKAMAANTLARHLEKVEGMSAKQAVKQAAATVNVGPRLVEKAGRIADKQPRDVPKIINGQKTVNEADREIRIGLLPLANVKQRVNEVSSAALRLEDAIEEDMQDAKHTDVRELNSICEAIIEATTKARKIIERVRAESTD